MEGLSEVIELRSKFTAPLIVASAAFLLFAWFWSFYRGKLLSADGAGYLLSILDLQNFHIVGWQRMSAQLITQWPVVLTSLAGIQELPVHYWAYAGGIMLCGVVALGFTLRWLWPRLDVAIFALFSVLLLQINCDFVLVGEHNILSLFVWPMLAFCLAPRDGLLDRAAFLLFAAVSVLTYETSLVVLLPILVLSAGRFLLAGRSDEKLLFGLAVLLCLSGMGVGAHGVLFPRDPANKGNFLGGVMSALRSELVLATLMMSAGLTASIIKKSSRWAFLGLMGALTLLFWAKATGQAVTPTESFSGRTMTLTVLPLLIAAATVTYILRSPITTKMLAASTTFILVASMFSVTSQVGWSRTLNALQEQVQSQTGFIPYEEMLADGSQIYTPWVLPSTSVLLSGGCVRSIVEVPPGSWQPFDPRETYPAPKFFAYDEAIGGSGC